MCAFAALADPVRRDILALLPRRAARRCISGALALPQPRVSKHLRALRDAGLVRSRIDGPRRLYSLDPAPLAELDAWLMPYRTFWANKLDALGNHLKRSN